MPNINSYANTLKVTDQTTLKDLQAFADKAGGDDKIRGIKNKDGTITLYSSDSKPKLISFSRSKKRQAAQEALTKILNNTHREMPDINNNNCKAMLYSVRKELRGQALKLFQAVGQNAIHNLNVPKRPIQDGPSLAKFSDSFDIKSFGNGLGTAGKVVGPFREKVIEALGKQIVDAMQNAAPNNSTAKEWLTELVAYEGDGLAFDLQRALKSEFGNDFEVDNELLLEIYKVASEIAADGDKQIDQNTVVVGGTTYTKNPNDNPLDEGSFGAVYKFTNPNDTSDSIIVKIPINGHKGDPADLTMHRKACGDGHDNVVGLKGAFRTSDGGLAIAMELAPYGNAYGMQDKISQAVSEGNLSASAAKVLRLTMLKDMLQGLQHARDSGNLIHLDIKPPNFLIGEGGKTKLADFGTSQSGDGHYLVQAPGVQNPHWKAPEMLKAQDVIHEGQKQSIMDNVLGSDKEDVESSLKSAISRRFKNLGKTVPIDLDKALATLSSSVKNGVNHLAEIRNQNVTVAKEVDTWSLGVSAFDMFVGEKQLWKPTDFMLATEKEIIEFSDNPNNRIMTHTGKTSGDVAIDNLINRMMHPDPKQRPNLNVLLNDPIFQTPGVGGQDARETIMALHSNDMQAVWHHASDL